MAKLKKSLPKFTTEEEEVEFWDKHSPLEFFDISDFEPLQVKPIKDRIITIRLDSLTRQKLDRIARTYKLGSSTLGRKIIVSMLGQWK